MSVAFLLQRDRRSDRPSMNAARLSSVTAWTVVQLRDPGQMHTSTDDWRYTRAAPQVIVAPAGFFGPTRSRSIRRAHRKCTGRTRRSRVSRMCGRRARIGRVAAYAGHVPAIQYTPTQHCCPCRLDCSIKNVFELGHYTGFLIRSFEPTRAR
jgi:hypothetical protein